MGAIFSACGTWRYLLWRDFADVGPTIAFLLHNPSTADAEHNDPTARRGIGYVKGWQGRRMVFANPWAACATEPADLWRVADPVGPLNDLYIATLAHEVASTGGFFVFAWGNVYSKAPRHLRPLIAARLLRVEAIVRRFGCDVRALGVTNDGAPRHILYLRSDATPVPWSSEQVRTQKVAELRQERVEVSAV